MGRADDRRAKYEAEMAVLALEDELVAAKEAGGDTDELQARLREARQAFRATREGDAAASPDAIAATAAVQEV